MVRPASRRSAALTDQEPGGFPRREVAAVRGLRPNPWVVIVSAVVFSIVGLAIVFLLGTAIHGIVWAAVAGLVSLGQDARDRMSLRTGAPLVCLSRGFSSSHDHLVEPTDLRMDPARTALQSIALAELQAAGPTGVPSLQDDIALEGARHAVDCHSNRGARRRRRDRLTLRSDDQDLLRSGLRAVAQGPRQCRERSPEPHARRRPVTSVARSRPGLTSNDP